ncbi:MAG: hypothetical protein Q7S53_05220 [bacterium]|nr:hypothetical protein [bacterium]
MNNKEQINHPEESNEELSTLKESLRQALGEGDMKRAGELREKIMPHLEAVKDEVMLPSERAKEIMGKDFFGPDEIKKALGIEIDEVPVIPFTRSELERAKELGQTLILRTGKASDGGPLTMEKIGELLSGKDKDGGKLLYGDDWYENEKFYIEETAKLGWALVSKETIPGSNGEKYLEQTEIIVDYLKDQVFLNRSVPVEYQAAIDEFESQKSSIASLAEGDWQAAAKKLEDLSISQLTRQTPVEVLYDVIAVYQNIDERLLLDKYTWTSRRDSSGGIVTVGTFNAEGLYIGSDRPGYQYGSTLGVSFSRRS